MKSKDVIKRAIDDGLFTSKTLEQWGAELGVTKQRIYQIAVALGAPRRMRFVDMVETAEDKVAEFIRLLVKRGQVKEVPWKDETHILLTRSGKMGEPFGDIRQWVYRNTIGNDDEVSFHSMHLINTCGNPKCISPSHLKVIPRLSTRRQDKVRIEQVNTAKSLIRDTTMNFKEISEKSGVSLPIVYKINSGRLWRIEGEEYPIRKLIPNRLPVRFMQKKDDGVE